MKYYSDGCLFWMYSSGAEKKKSQVCVKWCICQCPNTPRCSYLLLNFAVKCNFFSVSFYGCTLDLIYRQQLRLSSSNALEHVMCFSCWSSIPASQGMSKFSFSSCSGRMKLRTFRRYKLSRFFWSFINSLQQFNYSLFFREQCNENIAHVIFMTGNFGFVTMSFSIYHWILWFLSQPN